jgi:hypothetical protein
VSEYRINPCILFSGTAFEPSDSSQGEKVAEYWNEGYFRAKLTCYKGSGENFATITNERAGQAIKVKGFNCAEKRSLVDGLYAEAGEHVTVVGSRSQDDSWCSYSMYVKEDRMEGMWMLRYPQQSVTADWLEVNSC